MDGGNGWASAPDFQVHVPTFGERFRGKECPLSNAVGLKGISTQPALDYDVLGGANWDFRTGGGSRTLRRVTQVVEWIPGHGSETETTQDRLRQTDSVMVRQTNAQTKRTVSGFQDAKRSGRFTSLEHL